MSDWIEMSEADAVQLNELAQAGVVKCSSRPFEEKGAAEPFFAPSVKLGGRIYAYNPAKDFGFAVTAAAEIQIVLATGQYDFALEDWIYKEAVVARRQLV